MLDVVILTVIFKFFLFLITVNCKRIDDENECEWKQQISELQKNCTWWGMASLVVLVIYFYAWNTVIYFGFGIWAFITILEAVGFIAVLVGFKRMQKELEADISNGEEARLYLKQIKITRRCLFARFVEDALYACIALEMAAFAFGWFL